MIPSEVRAGRSNQLAPTEPALILAVDDDADNLILLDYTLEPLNCEFVGKTDGRSALEFVRLRRPDLILLDVIMPDLHGIELLHRLRQELGSHQVPILALTGMTAPEDKAELLSEGFSVCLNKPYQLEELEAVVRSYL
jgi:two-component system, cell cycle response regulator DivK